MFLKCSTKHKVKIIKKTLSTCTTVFYMQIVFEHQFQSLPSWTSFCPAGHHSEFPAKGRVGAEGPGWVCSSHYFQMDNKCFYSGRGILPSSSWKLQLRGDLCKPQHPGKFALLLSVLCFSVYTQEQGLCIIRGLQSCFCDTCQKYNLRYFLKKSQICVSVQFKWKWRYFFMLIYTKTSYTFCVIKPYVVKYSAEG